MTYNEWRDELKRNLLCVSDAERRRVLDYYAEAYADRRDAGFSEREIIEDFGAPYDAAQRILSDNPEEDREDVKKRHRQTGAIRPADDDYFGSDLGHGEKKRDNRREEKSYAPPPPKSSGDYTWVFVILCIVFAVPLFGLIMGMTGITIGFCAAPIGLLVTGVAITGAGVGALFSDVIYGATMIGTGLIIFGVSLILMPLCFKLVGLMWQLFKRLFGWIRNAFRSRETA